MKNWSNDISGGVRQNFSQQTLGMEIMGLGELAKINDDLNQQKFSHYYITKRPEANDNNALQSGIDANNLRGYINLFFSGINFVNKYKIDLEKSTFELKEKSKPSSFGKNVKKFNLKQLQRDLRLKSS